MVFMDKVIEVYPGMGGIKSRMKQDALDGWTKIISGNKYSLTSNERYMFHNTLIVAMNRLGVK